VDGKQAGSYQMTVQQNANGTETMSAQADVKVTVAFVTAYSYSYRGTESWKDGRLLRLDSTANDNGKRYALTATAEGNGLRVNANGQQRLTRADVWTTTYWRQPDPRFINHGVPLLDADTGKDILGKLEYLDNKAITVAGQSVPCAHYRVSGPVQVDLWYDGQERLVRQESIEEGHRTVLELSAIRR
jgi:hypothetical protein